VRVMRLGDTYELSLHVKLPRDLTLADAHGVIERLEAAVRAAVPDVAHVHTHIEPLARTDWASAPPEVATAVERAAVEDAVRGITGAPPAELRFRDAERGRVALVTITLPGEQPLPSAHQHAGRIEEAVRERCPALADVIVHTEPEPQPHPEPEPEREPLSESDPAEREPVAEARRGAEVEPARPPSGD
jgi:divalent metal cation (Fe/Co/Zn/Cd) transporter